VEPIRFRVAVIEWRGPAPFFYAPVPPAHVAGIRRASKVASYGWGVIPVDAVITGVAFTTSLFPKDDTYLLPLKAEVRKRCNITVGDVVEVEMVIRLR
jgi:hypothetical protein